MELELGETYCALAQWELAVPLLEAFLVHWSKPETWHIKPLAEAYLAVGRYDEALALRERYIKDPATSAFPHGQIGEIHIERGDLSKALAAFKKAVQGAEAEKATKTKEGYWQDRFGEHVGDLYLELGLIYHRKSREKQANGCFEKGILLFEKASEQIRGDSDDFLHRSQGRLLTKLGWLYEMVDIGDKRSLETYKQAVSVFITAIWDEDDFLEAAELEEATAAMERVSRREPWVYPGLEQDRKLRARARARDYRTNWGVNMSQGQTRSKKRHV
jgi:tetratricopeptide (TPR) repeat protein